VVLLELLGHGPGRLAVEVGHHDLGAGLGQPGGDTGADPAGGAGDDGGPPGQGDQVGQRGRAVVGNGEGHGPTVQRQCRGRKEFLATV